MVVHESVMAWVAEIVQEEQLAALTTLEVGSLDVNGSVRSLFTGSYWGVDMQAGPGVDEVLDAHALTGALSTGRFDVVVSTEMLEHDSAPWQSVEQMRLVLKLGGTLILTARGYDERGCFPVHGYPEDHWRYSVTGMLHLLRGADFDVEECVPDPQCPGVFALARA